MSSDRARWLLLGLAGVVLVVHSLAYNFVTDDAYISFVFSRNLAEHGQLTFNLGSPVEGYTNFLWTLVLGLLMVVGISPEWSSRVLATICALVTLYMTWRVMRRALGRDSLWACVPPLLLACSSGFACWTSGGLETQLFTMLVVIALDGVVAAVDQPLGPAMRRAAIALALAAMTRPEGLLVAAVLGVVRLACITLDRHSATRSVAARPSEAGTCDHRAPRQAQRFLVPELVAAAWFVAVFAPWFAWRYWYYGYPFPNTYYVKASGPWAGPKLAGEMWHNGLYYLWVWLQQTRLLYALPVAALGLVVGRARTPRFALALACTLLAATYLPYTASVGGDFMGLHRFIMVMFVVAAIAVVLGLEWLASWVPRLVGGLVGTAVVIAFAITQLGLTRASLECTGRDGEPIGDACHRKLANDHGIDSPAYLIVYTEDRAAIGRAMEPCFRDDDFSIVGGAGAQPYFGRMRGIDVFGLVSEKIAHDEPRIRARAGHTKFGSEPLLATYDPTFVFSCYQLHAKPEQPKLPCAGYWLGRGYEQVTMQIPGMREQGEYYTFLAKKSRAFQCPGRVH